MHLKLFARQSCLTLVSLSLFLLTIGGCGFEQPEIKIAIMGDQTGAYNLDSAYSIMSTAAKRMVTHSPDLLLHVGDMTESKVVDSCEYVSDFDQAVGIMNSLNIPWYLVAGDHDVNPSSYEPQSADRSNETRFRELCTKAGLPTQSQLYYSADFRGYHLVFLYSLENLHTDPRWGSIFLNGISEKQLEWLQQDLEDNKDAEGIIVVTHHPHWYSWSNWYPVHNVLREYPVVAVIGGHFHYDQIDGLIDGIKYLVVGATGGAIKEADSESGGCHEYALLNLKGGEITGYELHEVYSDSLLELTSRRSMDRIQAISSSMSNIYGDENLMLRDGKVWSRNDSGELTLKTVIDIESIANPIDLPVRLSIAPLGDYLESPRWVGIKSGKTGDKSVIFEPGEQVGWANYSSSGQWYKPAPVWQSDILGDSLVNEISPILGVRIKMEYEDTQPRWIASSIHFTLK
jgi:hypothetical protein